MANGDDGEFFDYGTSSDYQVMDNGGDVADNGGGFGFGDIPLGSLPAVFGGSASGNPPVVTRTGAFGGIAAAGGAAMLTLGARLAGMFGRGAGTAVINGVKFSMARLWPYIRQYGPGAVAAALGITVAELGALAMHAPQHARRRRRGISAADITRTKRVIRFNRQLSRSLGIGRGRSYSRPRRRVVYC